MITNILPQTFGGGVQQKFMPLKNKQGRRQWLGEGINKVALARNKADTQIMTQHLLTNIVVVYFYVFCTRMEHRVGRETNSGSIVTPKHKDM